MDACLQGKRLSFKVDTGSQANVLPLSVFRKFRTITLKPSGAVLRSYGGNVIKHVGTFSSLVTLGDRKICAEFFVVKNDHSAILGLAASEKLCIVKRAVESVTTSTSNTEAVVE